MLSKELRKKHDYNETKTYNKIHEIRITIVTELIKT